MKFYDYPEWLQRVRAFVCRLRGHRWQADLDVMDGRLVPMCVRCFIRGHVA